MQFYETKKARTGQSSRQVSSVRVSMGSQGQVMGEQMHSQEFEFDPAAQQTNSNAMAHNAVAQEHNAQGAPVSEITAAQKAN